MMLVVQCVLRRTANGETFMKIGIFTAMEKESRSFLKHAEKHFSVGAFTVYQLKLANHDAFLCCPPSVGEIAASAACQMLISNFGVEVVLNFGVVGSLTQSAALLSTMYVGSVVHYEMDLREIDPLPLGRYTCFDDIAVDCDEKLLKKAQLVAPLPIVRCASADKFVGDSQSKKQLNEQFGADICDMESAGVLFCCKFNNVPCLLVKRVSDSLVGASGEYVQNAERAAEGFFDFAGKLAAKL